jgi:hypothetical protein
MLLLLNYSVVRVEEISGDEEKESGESDDEDPEDLEGFGDDSDTDSSKKKPKKSAQNSPVKSVPEKNAIGQKKKSKFEEKEEREVKKDIDFVPGTDLRYDEAEDC